MVRCRWLRPVGDLDHYNASRRTGILGIEVVDDVDVTRSHLLARVAGFRDENADPLGGHDCGCRETCRRIDRTRAELLRHAGRRR